MSQYTDRLSLAGKTIIVTGACGLLGQEICRALADLDAGVVAADINLEGAQKLGQEIAAGGSGEFLALPLDISSEDSVRELLDALIKKGLNIDGLVNNAYPRNAQYGTVFENITLASWRENVDLHMNGYFNMSQQAARVMMRQKSGSIVNMASIYGILGPDFKIYEGTSMTMPAEYAAIKGGIINMTRFMATYLAPYNIRVNSISAGGIFNHQPREFVDHYCARTPLGRMGTPGDIAGGVTFLMSGWAGYMTGHNLVIDGGWSIW